MITTIYLIRHGESEANETAVFAGSAEYFLTKKGIKQAEVTAKVLSKAPVTAIYSSPLLRARRTAEPFSSAFHCPVIVDNELREVFCGDWERMPYAEIEKKYPDLFPTPWYQNFGEAAAPNGESVTEAGKRFWNAAKRIAEKHPGESVLITSHAGVIRSFYGIVAGIAPKDLGHALPFPTNASYSIVTYENGAFYPVIYSEDSELKAADMVTALKQ